MSDVPTPLRTPTPSPDSPGRGPLPWYLLPHWPWLALVVMVAGYTALGVSQFSAELASWHAAAGREEQLDGNPRRALSHLDNAVAHDSSNGEFYRWRAECYRELKQHERALAEYDRMAQIRPLGTWGHFQRADLLLLLDRRQQAVTAAREGLAAFQRTGSSIGTLGGAQVLNGVAYFRALAKLELDEALPQINEAIQLLGGEARIFEDYACLSFWKGDYPLALKMLSAADQIHARRQQVQVAALEGEQSLVKQEDIRRRIRNLEESRCQVSYRRLLVLREQISQLEESQTGAARDTETEREQLPEQLAAKQELANAEQDRIETEFQSSIEEWEERALPGEAELVDLMRFYAMVIDTRGFLYYQREEFAAAFQDLRLAVRIGEAAAKDWLSIQRGKTTDLRELERERRSFCRSLATIHYHRFLVASRLKANAMAAEDRQRIEELGHQPTPELF